MRRSSVCAMAAAIAGGGLLVSCSNPTLHSAANSSKGDSGNDAATTGDSSRDECVAAPADFLRINLDTRPPDATLVPHDYEGALEVVTSTASRLVLVFDGMALALDSKGLLPPLTVGDTVWIQLRSTLTFTSQAWFVAVKESQQGQLLLAHHYSDLVLFDAGHFADRELLGTSLALRERCTAFRPDSICTSAGATHTLLDVEVGLDSEPMLVSSGQQLDLSLDEHPYSLWVGTAERLSFTGYSTCADYVPKDFLELVLVRK